VELAFVWSVSLTGRDSIDAPRVTGERVCSITSILALVKRVPAKVLVTAIEWDVANVHGASHAATLLSGSPHPQQMRREPPQSIVNVTEVTLRTLGSDQARAAGPGRPDQAGRLARSSVRIPQPVAQVEPRQPLFGKNMSRRYEPGSLVDRTDVQMNLRRVRVPLARQRRTAAGAESTPAAGGRIVPGDLALAYLKLVTSRRKEHRDRGAAVPAATLAMTPCHVEWFTCHGKSHRATETAAFNAIAHALALPLG